MSVGWVLLARSRSEGSVKHWIEGGHSRWCGGKERVYVRRDLKRDVGDTVREGVDCVGRWRRIYEGDRWSVNGCRLGCSGRDTTERRGTSWDRGGEGGRVHGLVRSISETDHSVIPTHVLRHIHRFQMVYLCIRRLVTRGESPRLESYRSTRFSVVSVVWLGPCDPGSFGDLDRRFL